MRKEGISQTEVARKFKLSPTRIYLIEKQDAETRSMEEKRARLLKQLQDADDMEMKPKKPDNTEE
jgi:transcriptional regulator